MGQNTLSSAGKVQEFLFCLLACINNTPSKCHQKKNYFLRKSIQTFITAYTWNLKLMTSKWILIAPNKWMNERTNHCNKAKKKFCSACKSEWEKSFTGERTRTRERNGSKWGVLCAISACSCMRVCVFVCVSYIRHTHSRSLKQTFEKHMCFDRHLFGKLKYVWHEVNIRPNTAQHKWIPSTRASFICKHDGCCCRCCRCHCRQRRHHHRHRHRHRYYVRIRGMWPVVDVDSNQNGENLCLYVRQYWIKVIYEHIEDVNRRRSNTHNAYMEIK